MVGAAYLPADGPYLLDPGADAAMGISTSTLPTTRAAIRLRSCFE
jgi:hypothetical protein